MKKTKDLTTKEHAEKLIIEIFEFYNSFENFSFFGNPKPLNIYDVQHLIYRFVGQKDGGDKYAISETLKKYLRRLNETE